MDVVMSGNITGNSNIFKQKAPKSAPYGRVPYDLLQKKADTNLEVSHGNPCKVQSTRFIKKLGLLCTLHPARIKPCTYFHQKTVRACPLRLVTPSFCLLHVILALYIHYTCIVRVCVCVVRLFFTKPKRIQLKSCNIMRNFVFTMSHIRLVIRKRFSY